MGVLGLPVLAAARWRCWNLTGVGLYLVGVVLLVVWTAKSAVIADSSHDNPPAWPALSWMLAAVVAAGVSIAVLRVRRERAGGRRDRDVARRTV